jgi:dTDP-4-dehydrorhamnose 3,5-epimerase
MVITETPLRPACIIEIEPVRDDRGFFARTFCARTFAAHGLPVGFVQSSLSFNRRRGTLRGLHYQADPCAEGKLVRCTRGAAFDVIVDLRPGSPTRCRWFATELTGANARAIYVPPGFAHGFQTLADATELSYQMTVEYSPELARGVRWDDPALAIAWPLPAPILSQRDASWPDLDGQRLAASPASAPAARR